MASSDFMMTAEEIRLRNLKRRRILIATATVVFLLGLGFFGGRPMSNAIKSWQARRHASKAFAYMENENWLEARKEATAAYKLRPTEPQSVRAVARFLSRTRQPDALEFWQQLEKLSLLTRQDRQDEAAIAIVSGETARAETAVQALLESKGADLIGWLLAAQLAIQKGAADDAMSALGKIFNAAQSSEQDQLQAALLELALASGSEGIDERATDAWSRIEKISQGKSATALDALVLLARRMLTDQKSDVSGHKSEGSREPITENREQVTRELSQKLALHPLAKAPQKLIALDVQEHIDASRRDELVAQGIAQLKKTLETIPLDKALLGRELFLQYLDALGGLERWSEIKELLESDRCPLDPVVQHMYLARCNAQLGERTAGENNWQRALEAAVGEPGKLLSLGEYAEKNGIVDVAQSAFDAAAVPSPKLRFAQQGRLRIAQRSGETKKIHAVLSDMLKIWPNEAAVQNDEGYTRLLLLRSNNAAKDEGRRMKDESVSEENAERPTPNAQRLTSAEPITNNQELITLDQLAQKLVEKNPRSLPHRTFLALARLKQNRAADALAVYE